MTDASSSVSTMPATDVASVVLSLLLVIVAILALGWMYRRMQGIRGPRGRVMEVLATQPLGTKERIVLARIGNKRLVIGITAMQMQTLCELDDEDLVATEPEAASGFADRLRQALGKGEQ